MDKKDKFKVFFKGFIRIKGTVNWTLISFIGFLLGTSSLIFLDYIISFFVFLISTFCIMSFTFSINNYYDAGSDKNNPRRRDINAIASGKISRKTGALFNVFFVFFPIFVTYLFRFNVFLFCILLIFWMWIYSAPPLRLKGRYGFDIIWHFFAFFLLIIWGSLIAGSISFLNYLVAISFGIWSCIAQICNHIDDYTFDKKSGTKTYAVWVGIDKAKKTLKIVVFIHIVFLIPLILIYAISYFYTILILIIGGFFVFVLFKPRTDFPVSNIYYKASLFAVVVYVCCLFYHLFDLLGYISFSLL